MIGIILEILRRFFGKCSRRALKMRGLSERVPKNQCRISYNYVMSRETLKIINISPFPGDNCI